MESLGNKLENMKMKGRKSLEIKGNGADNGALQINAPAIGEYKEVGTRVEAKIEKVMATKIGTQINHRYVPQLLTISLSPC
jgi:hypothetical protein